MPYREQPDAEKYLQRLDQLQSDRANWDHHWQEIAELIWPAADEFFDSQRYGRGEKRSHNVYDDTAALALEKFSAALESLLTPRSQTWHRLRATDEELNRDPEVKIWFEELNRRLFAAREAPRAGYYGQKHEGYKSLGAFGNDCLFVDEDPRGGIKYRYCHVGSVWIEVDQYGQVDTVFRKWPMTTHAAVQRWGDKTPGKIVEHLESKPYREWEFLHVVEPRRDGRDPERMDAQGMPYASYYISVDCKELIEESGYWEFPYPYARYTVNPRERYGRSPAMLVLPSIKVTQEMQKTFLRAGHKLVDPPLLLHDDGVLGSGSRQVRLRPGGLNYGGLDSQGRPTIVPLQTGGRLDLTEGMLETQRRIINDAFLVTLFQILIETPTMTATEALLRAQEKGQLLAPTVGRQQAEMLGPQIEREVGIMLRQGAMRDLPMPPAMVEAEGEYEIEYVSDSTRLQRAGQLAGTDRTVERAIAMGQFDPTALMVLNPEEILRLSQEVEGAPATILRSPEEVAALLQQQQQVAQAQQILEGGERMARIAKDSAQAESQRAPLEGQGAP